jgi:hypothetical protein
MPRAEPIRRLAPAAVALAALVAAGAASAAFVIPPALVAQDRVVLAQMGGPVGDIFRLPTWAPKRYVESSTGFGSTYVDLVLTDSRYLSKAQPAVLKHSLAFASEVVPLSLAQCRAKKPEQPGPVPRTGRSAWVCLTGKQGSVVRLSAYGPGLSLATLRHVVTSAKPA